MSYFAHFSGSKAIDMFENYDLILVVFAFYGCFRELSPIVLGF